MTDSLSAPPANRRRLLLAKVTLVAVVAAFALSNGGARAWPLLHWPLYTTNNGVPTTEATLLQIEAVDATGVTHNVPFDDLLTLDDETSQQLSSRALVVRAVNRDTAAVYRPYLRARLEAILGVPVTAVRVYEARWRLDFDAYPPLNRDAPTSRRLLLDHTFAPHEAPAHADS